MRRPDLNDLQAGLVGFAASTEANSADAAAQYEQRVARNLSEIVQRELENGARLKAEARRRLQELLGRRGSLDELETILCQRLALGVLDETSDALMRHLRAQVLDQLAIDNPRYRILPSDPRDQNRKET